MLNNVSDEWHQSPTDALIQKKFLLKCWFLAFYQNSSTEGPMLKEWAETTMLQGCARARVCVRVCEARFSEGVKSKFFFKAKNAEKILWLHWLIGLYF